MTRHIVNVSVPMPLTTVRKKRIYGFFDWSMALYFFLVSLLDSTRYWYLSTYFAYFIAFIFIFQFSAIRRFRSAEFILYVLWTLWLLLTSLLSSSPEKSLEQAFLMMKINVMTIILLLKAPDISQLKLYFLFGLVGVTLISMTIGSFDFSGGITGSIRLRGMSEHVNRYGYVAFSGLIYAVLLFINYGRIPQIMVLTAVLIIIRGMLGCGSRAPAIAGLTMVGIYLFLEYARKPSRNIPKMLLSVSTIAFMLFALFIYSERIPLIARMEGIDTTGPKSTEARSEIYKECLELSLYQPVFGYGVGSYHSGMSFDLKQGRLSTSIIRPTGTHSAFLEIIFGTGYIGFFLFLSILAIIVYRLEKTSSKNHSEKIRKTLRAMQASIIAIIVLFFMADAVQNKQIGMNIGMIAGFALACHKWDHKGRVVSSEAAPGKL